MRILNRRVMPAVGLAIVSVTAVAGCHNGSSFTPEQIKEIKSGPPPGGIPESALKIMAEKQKESAAKMQADTARHTGGQPAAPGK